MQVVVVLGFDNCVIRDVCVYRLGQMHPTYHPIFSLKIPKNSTIIMSSQKHPTFHSIFQETLKKPLRAFYAYRTMKCWIKCWMKRSNLFKISKEIVFHLDQTSANIASQMLNDPTQVAKPVQQFPQHLF